MTIFWLILIVIAASLGQVLLKFSVLVQDGKSLNWLSLLGNKYFIGGVLVYGLTSIGWMFALKNFPLSKAYPMLALTFIAVPLLARHFFNEQIRTVDVVGMLMILAGVILINGWKS